MSWSMVRSPERILTGCKESARTSLSAAIGPGNVIDAYDYDAFGNLIHSTGTTPNNYLYAGKQFVPALILCDVPTFRTSSDILAAPAFPSPIDCANSQTPAAAQTQNCCPLVLLRRASNKSPNLLAFKHSSRIPERNELPWGVSYSSRQLAQSFFRSLFQLFKPIRSRKSQWFAIRKIGRLAAVFPTAAENSKESSR